MTVGDAYIKASDDIANQNLNESGDLMSLSDILTAHADALRQKTGVTEKLSFTDMTRLLDDLSWNKTNLLKGTSDQWRTLTNHNTWLQNTTASSCWTSVADYHGGDKFTYAAKITNNSHQQAELEIRLCDQNKNWFNEQAFYAPIPKGANAYDVNVTFPITIGTWYIRSWIIFAGGNAPIGDSVQVKDERLYFGTEPGIWTPNPADKVGGGSK